MREMRTDFDDGKMSLIRRVGESCVTSCAAISAAVFGPFALGVDVSDAFVA
mgnify:CR=1 FL=1